MLVFNFAVFSAVRSTDIADPEAGLNQNFAARGKQQALRRCWIDIDKRQETQLVSPASGTGVAYKISDALRRLQIRKRPDFEGIIVVPVMLCRNQ